MERHAQKIEEACDKSIKDLQCDYVDMYFIHWPFPNYHAPGCDVDSRNPDSKPFSVEEFMDTYRQCEALVEKGKIRYIGISNMTIPKLEAVLPLMKIKPATCELELHVCFQQQELYDYLVEHNIQPVAICRSVLHADRREISARRMLRIWRFRRCRRSQRHMVFIRL